MQREITSKEFIPSDYKNKEDMEQDIKKYISKIKSMYPNCSVLKEFGMGGGILIRVVKIDEKSSGKIEEIRKREEERKERELEDIIKEANREREEQLKNRGRGGFVREKGAR